MVEVKRPIGMGGGLLIAFVVLILASGAAIVAFPDKLTDFAFVVPIIFLFIAIGAFLLLLLYYANTLQSWNRQLPVSALGLPDGSIRAFLTIGLLSLVAVFGSFIYFESSKASYPLVRSDAAVTTQEQLGELRNSVGDRFIVIPRYDKTSKQLVGADVVASAPDTTRSDIAKQLLTMLATVLTTIIGFYFGSRTSEGPTGGEGEGGEGLASKPPITPPAAQQRVEALKEISGWTQNLDDRQRIAEDLVARAVSAAAELKSSGIDAEGKAETKIGEHKAKLNESLAALRAAQKTTAEKPDDASAILAARDSAKAAQTSAESSEAALKAFVEKKDPALL
jgi:hypothetical protein